MAEFPYSPNPAGVKRFLGHVQSAGVPEKVTMKYLEKVGFKSKNDRYLISILKFIGFLDSGGIPIQIWQAYRNRTKAGAVLAEAIRKAYSDLFATYPDAHRKDNEALRNYFSAHTKVAESTLGLIVNTFKALCAEADFEAATPVPEPAKAVADVRKERPPAHKEKTPVPEVAASPVININIQLQLPPTEDATIYEKLFSAMKKHLFS